MGKMKKYTIVFVMTLLIGAYFINSIAQDRNPSPQPAASQAQTPFLTPEEKRALRKNLVVKEMNADSKGKRKWMDHLTVWDENGFKLEEIEYAVYGQRERVTFEYDETGKCIRENVYNDKNKLYRIRKYEYLPNGRKKIQYNYNPDGKLYSTKMYEYSYK
jgi:antitoxin component YwqK of YwqJK toxin-antitoxin module